MTEKRFGKDLTEGSIPRHLLSMAIPMFIANFLNSGYSIVNTIWLGHTVGKEAVGAVAVSFPIVFILIALASGATMATSILVSNYYGARNDGMVRQTVNTSLTLALGLGVLLTIVGMLGADSILRLMETPESIFAMASSYLRISLGSFVFMFFSFVIVAILRGLGDTKTPLVFVGIGVLVNAILDPLLIVGVGPFPKMGLQGAAWASVVSAFVSLFVGVAYLNRKAHLVAISYRSFAWDWPTVKMIFRIGFPSMIQQSLVSLGVATLTALVNEHGPAATAAFGAAGRIDSVAFMPAMSMGLAVSALTGQNMGAGKIERVYEIFKWALLMITGVTLFLSLVMAGFPGLVMNMFVNDPEVIDLGVHYLRIVASCYIFFAVMFVSNGVINGAGHTLVTMLISLSGLWVVRLPLAAWLSHTSLGITGIWIAMVVSFFVSAAISLVYFRTGRWKKRVIRSHFPAGAARPSSPVPAVEPAQEA